MHGLVKLKRVCEIRRCKTIFNLNVLDRISHVILAAGLGMCVGMCKLDQMNGCKIYCILKPYKGPVAVSLFFGI